VLTARFSPFGFMTLSVFLFFRSDARLPLESKTAGIAAVAAMLLIELILVFYREPL